MKTSEVHGRRRKVCLIVAVATFSLAALLFNTAFAHSPYMPGVTMALMLVFCVCMVLAMIHGSKEFHAQRDELMNPPPDPDRPWEALRKDR